MTKRGYHTSRLVTLIFIALISVSSIAAEPDKRDQQIAQIMELSGTNHAFDQLPAMMQTMLQQQPPPLAAGDLDKFTRIMSTAVTPDKMRKAMKDYLVAHYDARHFGELVSLLQRPLVKKMTAMEQATTDPAELRQMMQQANVFMAGVPQKRLTILHDLDESMEMSETMLNLQIRSFQIMVKAINPLMPETQRMPPAQMETISRQMREQGLYPTRQQTLLQMAWAYRNAPDSDLQAYLKIYRSALGQWSKALMKASTLAVFDSAMRDISKLVKQQIIKDHAV